MPVIEQVVGSLVVDAATGVAKQGVASAFAKLQKERRLIGMSVWRPGGKARISVSALLRIQRDDGCFAVIKNLHRPEDYSAIGGVYKCHPKSGPLGNWRSSRNNDGKRRSGACWPSSSK